MNSKVIVATLPLTYAEFETVSDLIRYRLAIVNDLDREEAETLIRLSNKLAGLESGEVEKA